MGRIYLPFEDPNRGMVPTFGPILPGTPHPTLVGNPHLRGGPFVALPGYGMEAAEAATNLALDPDFPDLTNWADYGAIEAGEREVGPQFAMDQGEFLGGLHISAGGDAEGVQQSVTLSDATDYVWSVWVFTITGTMRLRADIGASEVVEDSTKTGEWERLVKAATTDGTACRIILHRASEGAAGYFWMPQLEIGTYATPSRVGAQPASVVYVPSPISETQTPWSIVALVTPDWDYDTGSDIWVFTLYEDATNYVALYYRVSVDAWRFLSIATSATDANSATSAHSRGDKIHLVITCDGYNGYLYVNGIQTGPLVMKSVQPTSLVVGAWKPDASAAFNGVVDDFAFIEGAAIPEFRVQELYRASLRGVPLHGVLESLS